MFHQPVLIFNPTAGKLRRNPDLLHRTKAALAMCSAARPGGVAIGGETLRLLPTTGPGMAGDLARQAIADGADLILVLGGDGTINEVLQGVAGTGVAMGVIPGGTANCLARELGLGTQVERAIQRLVTCIPTAVALGRITSKAQKKEPTDQRWFLSMCGAGLDAAIVDEVRPGLKRAAGRLAYWEAGLRQFRRRVAPMDVRVAAERYQCGFVLISNVRNYGGDLEIASGASLRHDAFEIVLFEGSNPLRYAAYMAAVGLKQVQKMPGVHTLRAREAEITTISPTQVDGEFFGRQPVQVEIVPSALTLLLPPTYR